MFTSTKPFAFLEQKKWMSAERLPLEVPPWEQEF